MKFQQLLKAINDQLITRPAEDVDIKAPVTEDSATVNPGGVFVARKGQNIDGHDLIAQAVENGAAAVVGERAPEEVNCPVLYAQVGSAQQALGLLAARYYDNPSRYMTVIGVTGTDGKTTTTNIIYSILKATGFKAGMISTVSAVIGERELPTGLHVTTPTAPEVQMYLSEMLDAGLTHCVLETTSHGLAQGRVRGVDYDAAVLTNLTHEHLDFHGSFENYREAKASLFKGLSTAFRKPGIPKVAVVNLDDENAPYFLQVKTDKKITYGLNGEGVQQPDLTAHVVYSAQGMTLMLEGKNEHPDLAVLQKPLLIKTALVGGFNASNILAACAVTLSLGCPVDAVRAGVEAMQPVPGRMERIDEGQDFLAIVDFAHTPNALKRALEAARTMIEPDKRIIAVFGSAGLRDREKRRLMAEVGAELADISVLTAEDPRTESLDAILQVMADGAVSRGGVEGETFYRVPDRGQALAFACSLAQPGDLVIACGKGHEQSMCFGTKEYEWDDREALRAALRGTPLQTLPTAQRV